MGVMLQIQFIDICRLRADYSVEQPNLHHRAEPAVAKPYHSAEDFNSVATNFTSKSVLNRNLLISLHRSLVIPSSKRYFVDSKLLDASSILDSIS